MMFQSDITLRDLRLMAHAELSITYTWSRALLQLTIQLTNLTNPYLTILTHHNNPYHNAFSLASLISLHSIYTQSNHSSVSL